MDSSRPIETDETFKVIHEGYALALIGKSDTNRVWYLRYAGAKFLRHEMYLSYNSPLPCNIRAIGVSIDLTQEVGEIYLRAIRERVPAFLPIAYLGDGAEAFANAVIAVFDSVTSTFSFFISEIVLMS